MKSHLVLKTTSGNELAIKPDASVTFHDKNPLFNEVEMYSLPFELPLSLNRSAFKNMDARDSKMRPTDIDGETIRVIIDGIPYRHAVLHVQQDQEINKVLPVNLDSRTKTFRELIEDMKCRDVPVDDDILIGEKIGDVEFSFRFKMKYQITYLYNDHGSPVPRSVYFNGNSGTDKATFNAPVTGFSYPGKCSMTAKRWPTPIRTIDYGDNKRVEPTEIESYINVSEPYPLKKYCNTRVCYAHYGIDNEGNTTSDIMSADNANLSIPEDRSPYWVLDAKRSASGICFYIAYFLERLFKKLGVAFDMTELTNIEDFNYMAFITTQCKYREVGGVYSTLTSLEDINNWLSTRGLDGRVEFTNGEETEKKSIEEVTIDGTTYRVGGTIVINNQHYMIAAINEWAEISSPTYKAYVRQMYATADNFPDATVSEVIESLEKSFGVRFIYDAEVNKVTVKLLRNVFRDVTAPIHLRGQVLSMNKMSEKITGVRVKYNSESDEEGQKENVRYGVRDYDTNYDYIDYPEGRTQIKEFADVVKRMNVQDMNVYVDTTTGDAFRIKVDKDANTAKEMKPTAFEVGQFKGIDVGDCSKENEEYIHELVSSFKPIEVNDVNYRFGGKTSTNYQPMLVPFVDEKMEHEFVEGRQRNPFVLSEAETSVYLDFVTKGIESYDPTSTDDGSSPLQNHDWGLTVGILRTGDGDSGVQNYDPDYDGFGNWRWKDIADDYCVSADTMDQRGMWLGKTDQANTFSLKIRAWKPFLYYIDESGNTHITPYQKDLVGQPIYSGSDKVWLLPCTDDERDQTTGAITKRIRSRGLADAMLSEFIYFLLNRTPYKITMLCETAQLADLPRQWFRRFEIDGKIGWIDNVQYDVMVNTGIEKVEIKFYALN